MAWWSASALKDKTDPREPQRITHYFHKPWLLRTLEEIKEDILALGQETDGLLNEIIRASFTCER